MEKYLLIPVFGKPALVEVDEKHLLEEFRRLLRCEHIETVKIGSHFGFIVDEEGKITSKPYNAKATSLLGAFSPDWIAGDAIFCGFGMRNGEPDITPVDGVFA